MLWISVRVSGSVTRTLVPSPVPAWLGGAPGH